MSIAALIILVAAGVWLACVAILMLVRPRYCVELMERMTRSLERSNWHLQAGEQGLRVLAGVALLVRAPASRLPLSFALGGILLVASSVMILIAPIRWHGAYGRWLVGLITPMALRILSPVPLLAGAGLVYAAY